MNRARPTIRCLMDELATSVESPEQRAALSSRKIADLGPASLYCIEHPLLAKASDLLCGRNRNELLEHQISSVTDNVWYRVKLGQFRGAAWIGDDGEVWLCAVGLRKAGDRDDFYEQFQRQCVNGSDIFLPNETDKRRQRLETVWGADDKRIALLRFRVIQAVVLAVRDSTTQSTLLPTSVDPESLASREGAMLKVTVTVSGDDSPDELTLSIEVSDYKGNRPDDVVLEVQRSIPGLPLNEWEVVPAIGEHSTPCWYTFIDASWVNRLLEELGRLGLEEFAQSPPDLTDGPNGFAHFVVSSGLTEALVDSIAVRAMCKRSFVPGNDPDSRPLCPECATAQRQLEILADVPIG